MPADGERRVGPYVLERELGRGGFGAVFLARHAGTGAPAALKVLVTPEGGGSVDAQRFLREIELARALDHPGIVRVLDAGEDRGRPWMALEYVEGRSLFQVLQDEPLAWRRAVEIARDVADALAHAHARGVLHRDVKPGNILLGRKVGGNRSAKRDVGGSGAERSDRGEAESAEPPPTQGEPAATDVGVVAARDPQVGEMAPVGAHLTDFGLARLVSTGSRLTRTGMALGTPEYMSPEQARGDVHDLTPATDVWGVGVVLYEMLAGRRAFEGDSPESVVEGVMLAEPPPLGPLRPDAPRGIERVVRVCLAKRPARRYPDAGALRDDLDRVLRDETPLARPPLARGARRALAGSVLGAGLVVLALAAVLGFRRAGPPEEPGPGVPEEAAEARALVLVARARTLRATAPEAGAALLAEAAALAPDHADRERWRLERGLLLWASGDPGAARAEWDRVPADRRERVASRLYLGLEALFGLRGRDAAAPLDEAAAAGGPESRLARGALAVLRMEWDAAREALREIPGWEAAILRGYIESAAPDGDPAVAVRELDAGLSEGIPLPWAFANRGLGRSRLGDSAGALADLERAIRSGGSTPPTHVNRGSVREQLGDTAGALEDYGTALGLDPGCAPAWNRRAVLRHRLGDPRGAFADVEEAIRLEPGAPHHLQTRALIREDLGDPAGAEEDLTAALAARPGSATLLYSRAVARQRAGDLAGALADYDASLRANPRQPQVLVNRAVVRGMLGDRAAALEDLGRAIALDPRDPKAFYNRANTLWDLGDLQAAEADYSRALELEPEEPDALGNRGEMRRRLGDLPGAERDLRAAVRIAPGKALFRVRLGLLLRDRRDWVGAAQALREGLARPDGSLPPGTAAQAREALAECEGRQGPVRR